MEYWSIGVMEYWKDQKTGDRMKSTGKMGILEYWSDGVLERGEDSRLRPFDKLRAAAWQGRQENSPGMLEEWNDGGKEIPPGLPLRQAQDDSLYKREEIGEKDGTNVEARRKGA